METINKVYAEIIAAGEAPFSTDGGENGEGVEAADEVVPGKVGEVWGRYWMKTRVTWRKERVFVSLYFAWDGSFFKLVICSIASNKFTFTFIEVVPTRLKTCVASKVTPSFDLSC
jgi:hypothetical protein